MTSASDSFTSRECAKQTTRLEGIYLEDDRLVVLHKVESEDVGEHEGLTTLTQNVDRFLQELHLNPRHVVLLHLLHLELD